MSFNDPFSILFGNGGDSRRNNANNDDPIILDVEADGDGPARNTNAGPSGSSRPPRGPANPRITRKPASGGSGGSRGSKILIGVVLALAIIVGLFFGLSRFITDLMWYGQLGFQSVVWTQLGVKIGLWVAYALLMALTGFLPDIDTARVFYQGQGYCQQPVYYIDDEMPENMKELPLTPTVRQTWKTLVHYPWGTEKTVNLRGSDLKFLEALLYNYVNQCSERQMKTPELLVARG